MNSDSSGTESGGEKRRTKNAGMAGSLRLLSGMANGTLCRYFSAVAVASAATGPLPHDIYYGPEALEPRLASRSPLLPVTPLRRIYSRIPLYFQFLLPPVPLPFPYSNSSSTRDGWEKVFMRVINC